MKSDERLLGRLPSGAIVEIVRTRQGQGWRYSIADGEPLVPDPNDKDAL